MSKTKVGNIALWLLLVLTAVAVLLSTYGGWLDPRVWGFIPGVAVIMFPVIAVVAIVVLLDITILAKSKVVGVVTVLLLACMAPRVMQMVPVNFNDTPKGKTLKVMTYNVAAFPRVYPGDTSQVMRTILDINPDIVLVQEMMHADRPFHYDEVPAIRLYLAELDKKFPYRSYPYKDDVAILSKYPFTIDTIVPAQRGYDVLNIYKDLDHYATLAFDVVVNGQKLRLISTHLHSFGLSNADKGLTGADTDGDPDVESGSLVDGMPLTDKLNRAFALRAGEAEQLREAIDAGPQAVILCGDFNDVAGSYAYNTLHGSDMRDAWRDGGHGYAATYRKHRLLFKIDHILYRGPLKVVDSQVHSDVKITHTSSDHYPQVTTFELTNNN